MPNRWDKGVLEKLLLSGLAKKEIVLLKEHLTVKCNVKERPYQVGKKVKKRDF